MGSTANFKIQCSLNWESAKSLHHVAPLIPCYCCWSFFFFLRGATHILIFCWLFCLKLPALHWGKSNSLSLGRSLVPNSVNMPEDLNCSAHVQILTSTVHRATMRNLGHLLEVTCMFRWDQFQMDPIQKSDQDGIPASYTDISLNMQMSTQKKETSHASCFANFQSIALCTYANVNGRWWRQASFCLHGTIQEPVPEASKKKTGPVLDPFQTSSRMASFKNKGHVLASKIWMLLQEIKNQFL